MVNFIPDELESGIPHRLAQLRAHLEELARDSGRSPEDITLVGVSKLHSAEAIVEAVLHGLTDIGENRVQEAEQKIPQVQGLLEARGVDPVGIRWHMVGHLQSNKAARAVDLFDVIQSVDSVKLAQKLSQYACERGKTLDIMLEVNTSGEPQKQGVSPNEVMGLLDAVLPLEGLKIVGFMTVGPWTDDKERICSAFGELRELRDRLAAERGIDRAEWGLSMGMSGDYPIAIAAGATIVRIGTAIFGERVPKAGGN